MRIKHRDFEPVVDSSAYISPTSVLVCRVQIAPNSRIMFGAVLDSEGSYIRIGECSIICENAVVRATTSGDVEHPVIVGDNVFIGPHTSILGSTVESSTYLATGVTVLQGAEIKTGAIVAIGALVHANAVIPNDFFVPPYTVAIGNPVQIFSPDEKEAMAKAIMQVGFAKVAFNIDVKGLSRADIYKKATVVRSKEFEHHFNDIILKSE